MSKHTDEIVNLEQSWNQLKDIILKTAEEVCGRNIVSTKFKRTEWWSDNAKEKVKEKKIAWKKYVLTKKQQDKEFYIKTRNEAKKEVKEAKAKSWEAFGNKIQENFRNNKREFWMMLKGLRNKRCKGVRSVKDKNNLLKTKTTEILEVWKTHYEEYFKEVKRPNEEQEENELIRDEESERERMIEMTELELAIKRMRVGKAAGYDDISPEFIKYGGPEMKRRLLQIFNLVWENNETPREWNRNVIVPIHKKGDSTICDNYRAICLSSVIFKLYCSILEMRLRKEIEKKLSEEQAAFRGGRQTQDNIFTLRTTIEKTINRQKALYLSFLDLKSAFDTVPKQEVWNILKEMKVKPRLRKNIKGLYQQVNALVRLKRRRK